MSDDAGQGSKPERPPLPPSTPIPIWARQWHDKDELAALLDVSGRTLQRRADRGDIERDDGSTPPRWRPCLTPWTLEKLVETDTPAMSGQVDKSVRTCPVDMSGVSGHSSDISRSGALQAAEVMSGQVDKDVRTVSGHVRTLSEDELEGLTNRVDHLEVELAAQSNALDDVIARLEYETSNNEQQTSSEHEEASTQPETLSWWRRLAIMMLMRLKLLADRLMRRLTPE